MNEAPIESAYQICCRILRKLELKINNNKSLESRDSLYPAFYLYFTALYKHYLASPTRFWQTYIGNLMVTTRKLRVDDLRERLWHHHENDDHQALVDTINNLCELQAADKVAAFFASLIKDEQDTTHLHDLMDLLLTTQHPNKDFDSYSTLAIHRQHWGQAIDYYLVALENTSKLNLKRYYHNCALELVTSLHDKETIQNYLDKIRQRGLSHLPEYSLATADFIIAHGENHGDIFEGLKLKANALCLLCQETPLTHQQLQLAVKHIKALYYANRRLSALSSLDILMVKYARVLNQYLGTFIDEVLASDLPESFGSDEHAALGRLAYRQYKFVLAAKCYLKAGSMNGGRDRYQMATKLITLLEEPDDLTQIINFFATENLTMPEDLYQQNLITLYDKTKNHVENIIPCLELLLSAGLYDFLAKKLVELITTQENPDRFNACVTQFRKRTPKQTRDIHVVSAHAHLAAYQKDWPRARKNTHNVLTLTKDLELAKTHFNNALKFINTIACPEEAEQELNNLAKYRHYNLVGYYLTLGKFYSTTLHHKNNQAQAVQYFHMAVLELEASGGCLSKKQAHQILSGLSLFPDKTLESKLLMARAFIALMNKPFGNNAQYQAAAQTLIDEIGAEQPSGRAAEELNKISSQLHYAQANTERDFARKLLLLDAAIAICPDNFGYRQTKYLAIVNANQQASHAKFVIDTINQLAAVTQDSTPSKRLNNYIFELACLTHHRDLSSEIRQQANTLRHAILSRATSNQASTSSVAAASSRSEVTKLKLS